MSNDPRIPLNEPAPGVPSGLLTDVWRTSSEPLPITRGSALISYYLQQGIRSGFALPMSCLITVVTIAISLFLFVSFLLLMTNIDRLVTDAGGLLHVTMYIKEGVPDQAVNEFIAQLEQNRSVVQSVHYTSKADALELFRKDLGTKSGFVIGLDNSNPLPASVDIVLHPDELRISRIDQVIDKLSRSDVVDEVVYGSRWVERVQGVLKILRTIGFFALTIILGIVIFLISNTIKLVIYSRRDEISIMQLVGAEDSFIRIPFVVAGTLQGFVGSSLALIAALFAFYLLDLQVRNSVLFGVALPNLAFLGPTATVGTLILGVVVGGVGSLLALGKFMNV